MEHELTYVVCQVQVFTHST